MSAPFLKVENVETYYGSIRALAGVDFEVNSGEIVTMIGANGAGKSTLMMTICGNPKPRSGRIVFDGREITNMPTHEIMRLGIAQSPEGRRIFPRMTVMENLQMGAMLVDEKHFDDDLKRMFTLFPRLKERIAQRGGTLSGGEQQMLCDRPRADGPSQAAAARRAVAGPGPADREADLRGHPRAQHQ